MDIIVRRYEERDEEAALDAWLRAWKMIRSDIDFEQRLRDSFRKRWQNLTHVADVFVAEISAGVAGVITLDGNYVDQFFVAPEYWGTGVAKALLDEIKARVRFSLNLDVNADNQRAIRFYEKNGFVRRGQILNAQGRPVLIMEWVKDRRG